MFTWPLLQWKSNKYYTTWVCVCCPRCLASNVHVLGYFVIESRILISIMALVFCFLFVLWCRKPRSTPFGLPGVVNEIWTRYLQSRNLMLLLHQWVWWNNLRKSQTVIKYCWISLCVTKCYENYSSMLELWMCNWLLELLYRLWTFQYVALPLHQHGCMSA